MLEGLFELLAGAVEMFFEIALQAVLERISWRVLAVIILVAIGLAIYFFR